MDNWAVRWSQGWIVEDSATVVLSAGSDRRLALPSLSQSLRDSLIGWSAADGPIVVTDLAVDQRRLLDRLVDVGAVVPVAETRTVFVSGDQTDWLANSLSANGITVCTQSNCDVSVLVRTRTGWPEPPAGPHLGIDYTMHHTVVLGPFVLPGLSSCTSCLDVRTARRWPIIEPSPAPNVARWQNVIAELLTIQLDLAFRNVSPLINATTAWDLERGTVDRQTLLKSPGCTYCDTGTSTGRISLPWER
jgi:hypothetical protein